MDLLIQIFPSKTTYFHLSYPVLCEYSEKGDNAMAKVFLLKVYYGSGSAWAGCPGGGKRERETVWEAHFVREHKCKRISDSCWK